MSFRNQKPDEDGYITVGNCRFPAYDRETMKILARDQRLNNISPVQYKIEPELSVEYF